tara:strand:- start:3143 stop:3712 length:570 start_codon:yes stop_codon:yes gene_type:complete
MSNPVVAIRDTGRNSARTGDVRDLADNVITSATSATTGTIAVTAAATYDVSFTQPADTSIKNLIMVANGNLVTAGNSGDDIDFDLGTAAGGGQIIDEKAIADDGGSAVTITANTPLYIIENGLPAVANKFANMNGGPATSEAMTLAASLYSSAARTLHIRLKPLATNLATAATTVTFIVEFQHLGVTPS